MRSDVPRDIVCSDKERIFPEAGEPSRKGTNSFTRPNQSNAISRCLTADDIFGRSVDECRCTEDLPRRNPSQDQFSSIRSVEKITRSAFPQQHDSIRGLTLVRDD